MLLPSGQRMPQKPAGEAALCLLPCPLGASISADAEQVPRALLSVALEQNSYCLTLEDCRVLWIPHPVAV